MEKPAPDLPRQICTIASNFTVDPIKESLTFWLRKLQLPLDTAIAPFDQIIQVLLGFLDAGAKHPEFMALFIQCERWFNVKHDANNATLTAKFDDLCAALAATAGRRTSRFVVLICPASPEAKGNIRLREAEQHLIRRLQAMTGIDVITTERMGELYPPETYEVQFDAYANKQAQIPYTRLTFATLGTVLARWLYNQCTVPRKVIVVDCDNTLWSGLAGEAGLDVTVSPQQQEFQRLLVAQSKAGRLICLCSKNNPAAVLEILERHDSMVLRREHLTAWKINWDHKPGNLQSLSAELSLDLNSFIFIDDDAFECASVRALHPQVLTIQAPASSDDASAFFRNIWALDLRQTTAEDRQRTQYYRQDIERQQAQRQMTSLSDFLASLNLSVNFKTLDATDQPRALQLLERTNQFNLNGRRRTEAELGRFMQDNNCYAVIVSGSDRFGDYGNVGLLLCRSEQATLFVESLLLSCRALGRGVERHIAMELRRIALQCGAVHVDFDFLSTPKNEAVRKFLLDHGIRKIADRWAIPSADWLQSGSTDDESSGSRTDPACPARLLPKENTSLTPQRIID